MHPFQINTQTVPEMCGLNPHTSGTVCFCLFLRFSSEGFPVKPVQNVVPHHKACTIYKLFLRNMHTLGSRNPSH